MPSRCTPGPMGSGASLSRRPRPSLLRSARSALGALGALGALALATVPMACSAGGASLPLAATQLEVASIAVFPDTLSTSPFLFAGRRPRLTAELTDLNGQAVSGAAVLWKSSDTSVATVTPDGVIVARQAGEVEVTATVGQSVASGHVSVGPAADGDVLVIAHRGFAGRFPENTLLAMDRAYALGADGVEIDVRLSRDGVPVIMHDPTVDRTTDGTGSVAAMTAQALRQLDACSKFGTQWGRCPVPTLAEALQLARGRGRLLLHIQDDFPAVALPRVLQLVREAGVEEQVMYICFNATLLRAIGSIDPTASLGYLLKTVPSIESLSQLPSAAVLVRYDALFAQPDSGRDFVRRARAAGIDVGSWTLWSGDQGRALLKDGNVRLISDVPLDKAQLR